MVDSIYRRAFERAYGYNFSTSDWTEDDNGNFGEDCGMAMPPVGLTKISGDILQSCTYVPIISAPIGLIGCVFILLQTIESKKINNQYFESKNETVIKIAYLSRYTLSALGLGFLAAPMDIGLTISRKIRTWRDSPEFS